MSACGGLDPDVVHGFDQTHANIAEVLGELVAANRERVARDGSEHPIAMGVLSTWLEAKVSAVDLADLLALAIKRLAAQPKRRDGRMVYMGPTGKFHHPVARKADLQVPYA